MAESDCQRGIVWYKRTFGKISFGIGVVLNSIVVLTCVPIAVHALYLPTRPMLWTGFSDASGGGRCCCGTAALGGRSYFRYKEEIRRVGDGAQRYAFSLSCIFA